MSAALVILLCAAIGTGSSATKSDSKVIFPDSATRYVRQSGDGCDIEVNEEEGWLFTPNYPANYENRRECNYVIRKWRKNVCQVVMTIQDFDLDDESGSSCRGDYLDVRDGLPGSQLLCGSLASGTKKTLNFPRNRQSMTLRFQSDGQRTRKGFMIKVQQLSNSCNRRQDGYDPPAPSPPPPPPSPGNCDLYLHGFREVVTSPNFPRRYPPNSRCRYVLQKADPSVCKVELLPRNFDLEFSVNCRKDFVELPGGNRICGRYSTPAVLEFRGDSVHVTFTSDEYEEGYGFQFELRQLKDSCDGGDKPRPPVPVPTSNCDALLATENVRLTSPGFPTGYPEDATCRYLIRRVDSSICAVTLVLKQFDLGSSPYACEGDYLQLPDRSRLCGALIGQKTFPFPSGQKYLAFAFNSDDQYDNSGTGFEIQVIQQRHSCPGGSAASYCDRVLNNYDGRLTSPGFPAEYSPNSRCSFALRKADSSVCAVTLELVFFEVGDLNSAGLGSNCERDYLEMPDTTKLCGSTSGTRSYKFPVGGDTLKLTFIADSFGSGRGFDIKVTQMPNSCSSPLSVCDQKVLHESGSIRSPNYPNSYPSHSDCTYEIRRYASDVCQVKLEFVDFEVGGDPPCHADYLEIQGAGQRLCGRRVTRDKVMSFPPGSDQLVLAFHSGLQSIERGFDIKITQIRNSCYQAYNDHIVPRICSTILTEFGYIESESYPSNYPPDIDCEYRVVKSAPDVCQLQLSLERFDVGIDSTSSCNDDFLEVSGVRYCGLRDRQTMVVDFPSNRNELRFRFRSDNRNQRSGFRIEIKQLSQGCPSNRQPINRECGDTFRDQQFDVISPGFQNGSYPPNEDCRYIVRKASYDVCALEVKYNVFDLEESDDCDKDFLEVSDQKICGRLPFDSTRTYEFPDDQLILRFRSDNFGRNAGFFMTAKQKKC